uniref:Uncharacterized protein n=1 Tax=Chromera velia CCMP2878 TaxID=1169474 RepID=A0A0G4H777_9ALVE|eukprot:Cvel_25002.t1-p1 / transcript=Cvel_25002.t1 / gene=Cvel_25002 / organism=Chromera_velia_CCMP2878 / gene_product=hypothetical protein / transcript_product=hypothetical protein / location=Cvel_scaffold2771:15426-16073(-) / protein_length=216 / sequence_SO=supercontig / SO=protein_coding / is_pseudo=false
MTTSPNRVEIVKQLRQHNYLHHPSLTLVPHPFDSPAREEQQITDWLLIRCIDSPESLVQQPFGYIGEEMRSVFFTRKFSFSSPYIPALVTTLQYLPSLTEKMSQEVALRLLCTIARGVEIDDYAVGRSIDMAEFPDVWGTHGPYGLAEALFSQGGWQKYTVEQRERIVGSKHFPWKMLKPPSLLDRLFDTSVFQRVKPVRVDEDVWASDAFDLTED